MGALRCASIERCDEATSGCVPACPAGEVYIPPTGPEGYRMGQGFTMNATGKDVGKGHLANSDRPHRVVLNGEVADVALAGEDLRQGDLHL